MAIFSDRYELSRAVIIVDDAPRWFRPIFFEQVFAKFVVVERQSGSQVTNFERPIGTEWFIERLAQLIRGQLNQDYLRPGYANGFLKGLLLECEWFFFYDAIEIAAKTIIARDHLYSSNAKRFPFFRQQANLVFQTSGIGWTLNQDGILERTEKEEQVVAEAQLRTIELNSPAKVHLAKARLMLQQRPCDSANSIKESVSAIESAGKKVYPAAATLGDVLKEIKKKAVAPPLMISIIEKVYGFASSEPGVRHGSSADERVTRAEAEFIYINALSTISYFEALGLL
jgi:hypothetical protein